MALHLICLNVRSLFSKLEISLLLSNHCLDVLTLFETWLNEWVFNAEVLLPGDNLLRQDRNRHGGVVNL